MPVERCGRSLFTTPSFSNPGLDYGSRPVPEFRKRKRLRHCSCENAPNQRCRASGKQGAPAFDEKEWWIGFAKQCVPACDTCCDHLASTGSPYTLEHTSTVSEHTSILFQVYHKVVGAGAW